MASNDTIIGRKLGDYRILTVLGQGGMARVYQGYDEKLDRYAAVKVIDSTMMIGQDPEEYRTRFLKEARAIARLRHPNIVGIYQFDQSGTLYYMAMSFVEGKDLRYVLKNFTRSRTFMAHGQVLGIIEDIASALDYAHKLDVIHRDVKPSNIMVTPNGEAVLTDFGLALNRSEGTIGNTFGSAYYIAPEQAVSSANAVPQSDLYSLGVVLYEMLAGQMPFNEPTPMNVALRHLNDQPPRPSLFNPALSPEIDRVILRTLEKDPAQRYASGKLLTEALKTALGVLNDDDTYRLNVVSLSSWDERPKGTPRAEPLTGSPSHSQRESIAGLESGEKTPPFRSYMDDTPTVTDSKASAGLRADMMGTGYKNPAWLLPAMLLAALILAIGLVTLPGLLTPPVTPVVTALLEDAATTANVALLAPTTPPTVAPTTPTTAPARILPSAVAITAETATTPQEGAALSTQQPTIPLTLTTTAITPTQSPPIAATEMPSAPVLLRYDSDTLVLWNRSESDVDVSRLTFVQAVEEGDALIFYSHMWNDGTRSPSALPPGDCFQIWTTQYAFLNQPDYCGTRHAWSQVAYPRWFWVSADLDMPFEVQRGGITLAVCRVGDHECTINLP